MAKRHPITLGRQSISLINHEGLEVENKTGNARMVHPVADRIEEKEGVPVSRGVGGGQRKKRAKKSTELD